MRSPRARARVFTLSSAATRSRKHWRDYRLGGCEYEWRRSGNRAIARTVKSQSLDPRSRMIWITKDRFLHERSEITPCEWIITIIRPLIIYFVSIAIVHIVGTDYFSSRDARYEECLCTWSLRKVNETLFFFLRKL